MNDGDIKVGDACIEYIVVGYSLSCRRAWSYIVNSRSWSRIWFAHVLREVHSSRTWPDMQVQCLESCEHLLLHFLCKRNVPSTMSEPAPRDSRALRPT